MMTETESTTSVLTPKRQLRRIPRTRGETREVVLEHVDAGGRLHARLVRVEGGGVDRTTGRPLKVFFELTVKVPREVEVTRTFAGQGDTIRAEWNARIAYLMAEHGCVDFSLSVGELGPRLWVEPKNLGALARLAEVQVASRTRMNSGDSDADSPADGGGALLTRPARAESCFALPWWAGSDAPTRPASSPRPEALDWEAPADRTCERGLTPTPAF